MKPCNHPCCPDTGPCRKVRTRKLRKPIPKVNRKRAKEHRKYSALRKKFLSVNPECTAKLEGCGGVATEVHHSHGRVGDNFLDVSTWVAVCRSCHSYLETQPLKAKELGLSDSRLSKS